MRKVIAILLLSCLFFVTTGYHFLFLLNLRMARQQMKEYLTQSTSHHFISEFRFTETTFSALPKEGDHEIKVGGEWYDVLRISKQNDEIIVRCVADKKETLLMDAYQKELGNNNTGTNTTHILLKIISTPFSTVSVYVLSPLPEGQIKHTLFYQTSIPSGLKEIITPPPRFC